MSARHRQRRSSGGPTSATWFAVLAVTIVVGGGALALIKRGMAVREEREAREAPRSTAMRPFADMPPEAAPERGDESAGPAGPFAGVQAAGELSNTDWRRALVLAEEADALYEDCVQAKRVGRAEVVNEKGRRARRKYDEALELTAVWETELIETHGETHPGVREIMRTRTRWFDHLRWLHKSVAR